MASDFPGSPRLLKGALVVFGASVPCRRTSSPSSTTRTRSAAASSRPRPPGAGNVSAGEPGARLPPTESFSMSVELDATDQLEDVNPLAVAPGCTRRWPRSSCSSTHVDELILSKVLSAAGCRRAPKTRSSCSSGASLRRAGARRVGGDHGAGLRPVPQPDPGEGRPRPARADRRAHEAGAPFDTLDIVNQIAKEVLARRTSSAATSGGAESSSDVRPEADTSTFPRPSTSTRRARIPYVLLRLLPPGPDGRHESRARAARPGRLALPRRPRAVLADLRREQRAATGERPSSRAAASASRWW